MGNKSTVLSTEHHLEIGLAYEPNDFYLKSNTN